MHHETLTTAARAKAREAWGAAIQPDKFTSCEFDDVAFEAAMRAYMMVLANQITTQQPSPQVQKALDAPPVERTPGEHFLAMCSGHYEGYTMTSGMLPDMIVRKMICYQPDSKSSILYPLFISLMKHEMEHVVDPKGNPFLIAMTGGTPLTVLR